MDVFFYGTLMDADVLALVTGTPRSAFTPERGLLWHHEARYVKGECYPALVEIENAFVQGHIHKDFPESLWPKLCGYEGEDYEIRVLPILNLESQTWQPCHVFMRNKTLILTHRPWHFDVWQKRHKQKFLERLLSFEP